MTNIDDAADIIRKAYHEEYSEHGAAGAFGHLRAARALDNAGRLAAPDLAQTVIEQGKRIKDLEAQNKALRNTDTSEWGY